MPSQRDAAINLLLPTSDVDPSSSQSCIPARFTCAYCDAQSEDDDNQTELLSCSSCAQVWYCNEGHLLADWSQHQFFCRTVLSSSRSDKGACRSQSASTLSAQDSLAQEEFTVEPLSHPISRLDKARARANLCGNSKTQPLAKAQLSAEEKKSPEQSKINLIDRLVTNLRNASQSNVGQLDHSDNVSLDLQWDRFCLRAKQQLPAATAQVFIRRRVAHFASESLLKFGWTVVDSLLGESLATQVQLELEKLYAAGQFQPGTTEKTLPGETVRGDKIYWWAGGTDSSVGTLVYQLDCLMAAMSTLLAKQTGKNVVGKSKAMISCFPGEGSRYFLHVNNPSGDGRMITCVYHANRNWTSTDGGRLRLYPSRASKPIVISPVLDRLVLFWSDHRCPHEIEPTTAKRFSITTWYQGSVEGKIEEKCDAQPSAKRLKTVPEPIAPVEKRAAKTVVPKVTKRPYNRRNSETEETEEPVMRACRKCRDHACHATVRYNRKYNRAKDKLAKQQQKPTPQVSSKPKTVDPSAIHSEAEKVRPTGHSLGEQPIAADEQSSLEAAVLAQMTSLRQKRQQEEMFERQQKFYQHCQSLKAPPNLYQQQMLETWAKEMFQRNQLAGDKDSPQIPLSRHQQKPYDRPPTAFPPQFQLPLATPNRIPTVPQTSTQMPQSTATEQFKSFAKYFELLRAANDRQQQFYQRNQTAVDQRGSVIQNVSLGPYFNHKEPQGTEGESSSLGSLKLPTYHPC